MFKKFSYTLNCCIGVPILIIQSVTLKHVLSDASDKLDVVGVEGYFKSDMIMGKFTFQEHSG